MATIQPTDIGLATYNDVGDVNNLQTTARTVVGAVNEILNGGNMGTQKYVQGTNNKALGENNVIVGNNNIVYGDNNLVIGNNIRLFGSYKTVYVGHNISVDATTQSNFYYSGSTAPFSVGDKIAVSVDTEWRSSSERDYVSVTYYNEVCTVTSINTTAHTFEVDNFPVSFDPPDEIHTTLSSLYTIYVVGLNSDYSVEGADSAFIFGEAASTYGAFSINSGTAKGRYSFAANYGNSVNQYSTALNNGTTEGDYSLAINHAKTTADDSLATGTSIAASRYSVASGLRCCTTYKALKVTSYSGSNRYFDIDQSYTVSGNVIVGSKLFVPMYNSLNSYMLQIFTVSSVSGQRIYINETFPTSGSSACNMFSDKMLFVSKNQNFAGYNFVNGMHSIAGHLYSLANGNHVLSANEGAVIFGKHGITTDDYSINLGNGTSYSNTGLAFKVTSQGNVSADGQYTSPCADYAEFFEWLDGNPNNEDRAGYFVKLNGEKIVKCEEFDKPLGIVSATPAIIGDSSELHWQGKFVTDDFGRIQYHEVTVPEEKDENDNVITPEHTEMQPMINPDWNPNEEYIPRKDRKEWSTVGVLGKLIVYDDGTLQAGDLCRCGADGKAVKSIETGYPVLKRIANDKVLVWFKE